MNSITASSLIKSPIVSSLLALAIWIVGALSGSIALMIASGILAYGRPLLYSALLNNDAKTEKSAKAGFGSFASLRPSAASVR
jgi:ABC-type transport system involved in multi-copper enzyme maturation permease subunit